MSRSDKPKNHPIGQIQTWWNLLLLARQFEMTVSVPAKHVVHGIRGLHQLKESYLKDPNLRNRYLPTRSAKVETIESGRIYRFEICLLGNDYLGGDYASVKAVGRIIYSEGHEGTIIHGVLRISATSLLLLLWGLLFFILLPYVLLALIGSYKPVFIPFILPSIFIGVPFLGN